MKRHLHAIVLVSVILILSFAAYGHKLFESEQDPLTISLDDYNRITGNTEKKVLVYFHASWCQVCAKMKPIIEELSGNTDLQILKVDTDHCKQIKEEFEIDGLPVFMFYNKGKREWIHVGIIEKNKLLQKLNLTTN